MYEDEPSIGMTIVNPENRDELKAEVYAYRDKIYNYLYITIKYSVRRFVMYSHDNRS